MQHLYPFPGEIFVSDIAISSLPWRKKILKFLSFDPSHLTTIRQNIQPTRLLSSPPQGNIKSFFPFLLSGVLCNMNYHFGVNGKSNQPS